MPQLHIWLPGGKANKQHGRLRTILSPLCDALRQRGFDPALRSMLDDDFGSDTADVNIWLATELGEFPPTGGVNILWFLTQMKIMTQPVLMAHDAILTASKDHHRFLQGWLGNERHIGLASWPVADLDITDPTNAGKQVLELEPVSLDGTKHQVRIKDMPADAAALHDYLRPFGTVTSNLPLRERMCGFFRYEEAVALIAGCTVLSKPRQGLVPALDAVFETAGPESAVAKATRAQREAIAAESSVGRIADRVLAAVDAARHCSKARDVRYHSAKDGFADQARSGFQDEWANFCRDAAGLLGHPRIEDILDEHTPTHPVDMSTPWDVFTRLNTSAIAVDLPWTDLSLARAVFDAGMQQAFKPTQQDRSRLSAITQILATYRTDLLTPSLSETLPEVPWNGVMTASSERRRVFNDLSRAVNGHCLYRFSKSVGKPKKLSDALPVIQADLSVQLTNTAIFIHAFYTDIAFDILAGLPESLGASALHLTTDTEEKARELETYLAGSHWTKFKVHIVCNRGRDIYPKLVYLADLHQGYDHVLHLHTKRSPHSQSLRSWGKDTVANLAGTAETLNRVFVAFAEDDRLGIIYSDPPKHLYPAMSWVRNLRISEMLAAHLGLGILPQGIDLDFPVGSMFWVRTAAIAPLLSAGLGLDSFPLEDAQEDGTLAHSLERVLGVVCQSNGWRMARIGP